MKGVSLELAVFVAVALVAAAAAPGHAGWVGDGDGLAAAATLSPVAGHGPGAIVAGWLAALVPVGELAFRVALVGGLALAACCAGVVALARALTPAAAGAGALAASVVAIAPAAGLALPTAGPALTAALAVWILVAIVRARREARPPAGDAGGSARGPEHARPSGSHAAATARAAAAGVGALVALDPLTAVVLAVLVAATLGRAAAGRARLTLLALALATAALLVLPLALRASAGGLADLGPGGWRSVLGPVAPHAAGAGAALARLIDGPGAVLVLAGLLGLGLGATTGLPGAASCVVAALGLAVTAGARADGVPLAALAVAAAGVAPLAAAVSRLGPAASRSTIATIAALPVAVVAAVAPRHLDGPERTDAAARVAADVLGAAPAGPGVVVVEQPAIHAAARVEQLVGGLRPDLALARRDRLGPRARAALERAHPELHTPGLDDAVTGGEDERLVVLNLRRGLTAAADSPGFGHLDPRLARPAGRGFALGLAEPATGGPPPAPPAYPGPVGARVAAYLAVERARLEAVRGELEAAARAAGQAERFGAAGLALLDGAVLDRARPALFGFVPGPGPGALPPRWLPDLLGDDLAWVGGLPGPTLADDAPVERRLHARWRAVLAGELAADDASLLALGVPAARATARMLADLGRAGDAERAARALLATTDDAATTLVLGSVLAERGGIGGDAPLTDAQRPVLEEASRHLARAAAADGTADTWVVHGLVLHRLGRFDEARSAWRTAAALAPGRADVADLLAEPPSPR